MIIYGAKRGFEPPFGHMDQGDLGALYGTVRSLHQHHDLCFIDLCTVADTTGSRYPRFSSK